MGGVSPPVPKVQMWRPGEYQKLTDNEDGVGVQMGNSRRDETIHCDSMKSCIGASSTKSTRW